MPTKSQVRIKIAMARIEKRAYTKPTTTTTRTAPAITANEKRRENRKKNS